MAENNQRPSAKRWYLTWKIVFLPIAFFVIVFLVGATKQTIKQISWSKTVGNKTIFHPELASCGNKQEFFTVSPVKFGEYKNIVPLGAYGPTGGHIIPTKHIYFMSTADNPDDQTDVNIYAPGDLYITYAERGINNTAGYTDYYLYTSPCKDVEVNFYHLNTLNQAILSAFDSAKKKNCRDEQNGQTSNSFCGAVIKGVQIKAGDILGVGNPAKKKGLKQFFDFEMSDHRVPELQFANPKRWTGGFDFKHIVCPVDYFKPELKSVYETQFADYNDASIKRTVKPLCGQYAQDIAGTAQGVWFKNASDSADTGENGLLTLGHHNALAQKGLIAVGTDSTSSIDAGAYPFDPKASGLTDRDFKDITPDGRTYCFEPTGITGTYRYPFRVLLQMTSATTLKIEGQKDQDCGAGPWVLTENATAFER